MPLITQATVPVSGAAPARRLDRLAIGASGVVTTVGGDPALRRRLLEMGFCPGVAVTVVRVAPLGDPIEVVLRGYHLSLRRAEAALVSLTSAAS